MTPLAPQSNLLFSDPNPSDYKRFSFFTILVSTELASSSFYFPLFLHALDITDPSSKHVQKGMGSTPPVGDSDSFAPQVRKNRTLHNYLNQVLNTSFEWKKAVNGELHSETRNI